MSNPLLAEFDTPFQVPPFEKIKNSHYLEALEAALSQAKKEVDSIIYSEVEPSFENVIEALENAGERLGRNSSILFNLNSAETNDEIQKIAQEITPKLSAFNNEVKQNEALFKKVDQVFRSRQKLDLSGEQMKLLQNTHLEFIRRGVELEGQAKTRFKEISIELSKLSLSFQENLLHETNDFQLIIHDQQELAGLPEDLRLRAKEAAKERGMDDKWVFTLQAPSYIPFMESADNRELREQLYRAYMSKCYKGDARDNQEIILKMVRLKSELSALLGYSNFAEYVLEERMAGKPETVLSFLKDLLEKSLPKATDEVEEIKSYMKSLGVDHELERWDWSYYSEKLRKAKYDLDDELIKPYFKLEHVIDGVFQTAERLFGISFVENESIPSYHEQVRTYEVKNGAGEVVAVFLADFFPRAGKRGGAWMTSFRNQKQVQGVKVIPQVSIVCNFTPSTATSPSLLKSETSISSTGNIWACHGRSYTSNSQFPLLI